MHLFRTEIIGCLPVSRPLSREEQIHVSSLTYITHQGIIPGWGVNAQGELDLCRNFNYDHLNQFHCLLQDVLLYLYHIGITVNGDVQALLYCDGRVYAHHDIDIINSVCKTYDNVKEERRMKSYALRLKAVTTEVLKNLQGWGIHLEDPITSEQWYPVNGIDSRTVRKLQGYNQVQVIELVGGAVPAIRSWLKSGL